ncbi:hypothetical protein [Celeribacter neptunius]|uniref:Hemoglobin-like flavoprotein n=1 Tax=Celeribacter neptunius TaxID=588602 RepID=A0A1I3QX19_9RHOB|nr:hypothetical protein [Celeribacter neptunius]SFJ38280.1 Hemoglobin-like flavoprotein [Celeribacter neptunius]
MDEQMIALVKASLKELQPHAGAVFATFQSKLAQRAPELAYRYDEVDPERQGELLFEKLAIALGGVRFLDRLVPALGGVGLDAGSASLTSCDFARLSEVLIAAFAEVSGNRFDPCIGAAWTTLFEELSWHMFEAQSGKGTAA